MALHIDAAGLAQRLATTAATTDLSVASGCPVVVVDLHGRATAIDPQRLAALPCVTIGILDDSTDPALAQPFDIRLDHHDRDLLDPLLASIEATPLAAAALAILLRGAEPRSVDDGLAAESAVYSVLQAGPEFAAWRARRPARPVPHDYEPAVLVDRVVDTVTITLNRPARHNAFSRQMRDELVEALELATADATIDHVVLEGAGPSFCSGGDLDEFGSFPDPATAHLVRLSRSPARLVAGLADRTEVRLHGAAMGAGIELPAFAGRVVAAPDTVIGLPEVSLGLIPGAGGTVSLPRRIGRQRTALLALSGGPLDAATALSWGLVDAIEPR
jgi:hypothetical protein